ncbi:MAG: divalent-cation tolerance protein CutA [Syntrophorhabdaceae bacterium]|nr:divalent-cation tolerance protein CutA [Syntrophorhabdales bacterium]MBP9561684.1 divalent-cation tolerance protein CutA [Syntrophorhabdaceae bacterium]
MEKYIQIHTTTDRKDTAENIARVLLEGRLAACVQIIGPITSLYWWEGKIETTEEWLCLIKSKKGLYRQVEETVRAHHNYKVPEIIAVEITDGSYDYLDWLKKEVKA